ncbi:hypothetical protein DSO57_1008168 [Entomophthora muscae]|uniref:Uncharacterized protein n=1 Tax=Entomophthora muscae TaxID=34485 RepID=A0ACC2T752_9FUNG|nr:hypothetical protein DSO57_1008168 [Entomophthora muscae]
MPEYFQTTGGNQGLKKVSAFLSQVPMPCVMAEPVELLTNAKKAKYNVIPKSTCETFMRLMEDTPDC